MRFNIGLLIFSHIVLPAIFLVNLVQIQTHSQFELLLATLVTASYAVYIFIVGRWDWFGYWLRFVLLIVLCVAVSITWAHAFEQPWWAGIEKGDWVENLVRLGLFLTFCVLAGKALFGFRAPANAIDVSFPLHKGTYYIAQGGGDSAINYHYNHTAQRYALDIVKLGKCGTRAAGIYPKTLGRYFIFNDSVFSPVEGIVLRAIDGIPDLVPPESDSDAKAGNHVVIQPAGTGLYILLAHMKRGSIRVRKGDRVHAGQILGLVGNSGNTTEPHLHIHCATLDGDDYTGGGTGVPLLFGGKFLPRNRLVRAMLE